MADYDRGFNGACFAIQGKGFSVTQVIDRRHVAVLETVFVEKSL